MSSRFARFMAEGSTHSRGDPLALAQQAADERRLAVSGRPVPQRSQVLPGIARGQERGDGAGGGLGLGRLAWLDARRTEREECVVVVAQAQRSPVDERAPVHRPIHLLDETEGLARIAGPAADDDPLPPGAVLGPHEQTPRPSRAQNSSGAWRRSSGPTRTGALRTGTLRKNPSNPSSSYPDTSKPQASEARSARWSSACARARGVQYDC